MEFSKQSDVRMNLRSKKPNAGVVPAKGVRKAFADVNAARCPLGAISKNINRPLKDDLSKPLKKPLKEVEKDLGKAVPKTTENSAEDHAGNVQLQDEQMVENENDSDMFPLLPLPDNVDDIDCDDALNPQLVSEYVLDIYRYLWKTEMKFPIKRRYLTGRSEINGKMRAILVDWLVQVHSKFQLLQETLYLTVSIVDRFLQVQEIRKSKLQLVGVSAMFIASKFEEMYAPEVGDFVYITDNAYTKTEILKMEGIILRKLDFNLSKPLPLHFLRRDSKAGNVDATMHTLGKYLLELMLIEYDFVHYLPSLMAAAALSLSMKLLENASWSEALVYYSKYTEEEIRPIVCGLCRLVLKRGNNKNAKAINQKYATAKLFKISTIPELNSNIVVRLAAELNEVNKNALNEVNKE